MRWIVLVLACLVGLISESGPPLVFVTLYVQGSISLSVLLVSCIVQDRHGMLPVLADSRRVFVQLKAINFIAGLLCRGIIVAIDFDERKGASGREMLWASCRA